MKKSLMTASIVLFTPFLTSFVLLGKQAAKLGATAETPTITFHWSADGNTPSLSEKDKYKDGSFANYSDADLTPVLIQEAMDQWNNVRGSYLRFAMETNSGDLAVSRDDKINNIVVKHAPSASTAAYAAPEIVTGTALITDCDIVINDIKSTTLNFMETITHELGHCVGLGHPHTNYGAIMSYSRGGDSYRLSPDDKSGAIYLYPDPNYVDSAPKDLIGCGTIKGQHSHESAGPWLYWALSIPVAFSILRRKNLIQSPATQEQSATSK